MSSYDYYATVHKRYVFGFSKGKFPTGIKDQFTAIEVEDDGKCRRIGFHGEADQELTRLEDIEDALDYISPNNDIDMFNPDIIIVVGQADRKYIDRMLKDLKECPRVSLIYFETILPYLLLNKQIDVIDTLDVRFYQNFYRVTLREDDSLLVESVESVGDDAVQIKGEDFVVLHYWPNLSAGAKKSELERIQREAREEVERIKEECRAESERVKAQALGQVKELEQAQAPLRNELENVKAKLSKAEKELARYNYIPQDYDKEIVLGAWGCSSTTSEKKAIPWRVLYRDTDKALVISKYALTKRRFDGSSNNWDSSEIKRWLNGEFLQQAFSAEERQRISGGVFLLSKEEAETKYFKSDSDRACNMWPIDGKSSGSCWWWLRAAFDRRYVYDVDSDGDVVVNLDYGYDSYYSDGGAVRPAFWLKI